MKTIRYCLGGGRLLALFIFTLAFGGKVFAQVTDTNPAIPVVTIQATKPFASGPQDPGIFTVFRAGNTNEYLNIYYLISGSASNGVDYAMIGNFVAIPAGATSNTITITPLTNASTSVTRTVDLTLSPSPTLNPVNYEIGNPSNAVVYITGITNTNIPPSVRIISPANGAVFRAPINIPLYAYANELDGSIVSVEFFAGSNSLGFGTSLALPPPLNPVATTNPPFPTNVYFLVWSNATVGSNTLTAKATDNGGASTVSAPVNITVLPPLPPPTNRPPVVSIVATDPVAIEGTNCWVWPGESNALPTWAAWPTAVCRYFTNCGPKTATFTVFRCGDTNGDLTVFYGIGGTASNGVDYVTIPGFVTIPSGERLGLITIVPIDDGPPGVIKTVILTLNPSTNTPPDYLPGFPRRAAAIIIDSIAPRPVAGLLPIGCFHFVAPGPDAAWFCIEYSTDLANWTPFCTNQVVNGSIDFVDPDSQSDQSRFYRVVPLAGPPSD